MTATGDMTPKELRARVESAGAWGLVGSTTDANRYTIPKPDRRGRRICWVCTKAGASTRATHRCFANGVCLTADMCEPPAPQWAREPP